VLFCHATPRSNTEIFTRLTPEERVLELFGNVDAAVVVCGHTHMQFDRQVAGLRVVNAGSVGMPFGDSGAYWVSLGPSVSLRGTPYDLEDAARRIRQTAYPQAQDFAKNNVLCPPTEQEVLAAFVQMESR
jgi:diadenosine tetraphosphatase ApaH/serine/threonine PP2A family protein phosphatase